MFQIANPTRHTSLRCLSARVVRRTGQDTAALPLTLRSFVAIH